MNTQHCPRCNGHVYQAGDHYGSYLSCLQCGWVKEVHSDEAPLSIVDEKGSKRHSPSFAGMKL